MADKVGLGAETRELKLGPSFSNGKSSSFHTIRYDFKPASVDLSKMATVDIGSGNDVTVTVPHLDGTSHTVFRGSQRPYQKECVLIFDRNTGEITLEKLTYNIQVKKTRMESSQKPTPFLTQTTRSTDILHTTQKKLSVSNQRSNSRKKSSPKSQQLPSSLTGCIPKHSPLHASPSYPSRSPPRAPYRSPQNIPPSVASSLPLISVDEPVDVFSAGSSRYGSQQDASRPRHSPEFEIDEEQSGILPMSTDSSSDSFSSGSESEADTKPIKYGNGHINGTTSPALSIHDHLLKEDLQLSESGSDSD